MIVSPIQNTIGLYYEREDDLRISEDHWNLIVYKDLSTISEAFNHNQLILDTLNRKIIYNPNNTQSFSLALRAHAKTLGAISNRINTNLQSIQLETSRRYKRGILNGIGSIWKAISGNLDAADGEYFNDCINKLEKDDREIQTLLKSQIHIVSTTIKNFNNTIRRLIVDEKTFNNNILKIQTAINDAQIESQMLNAQLNTIDICESLLESFIIIEEELRDVIDSLTFSKLGILHPSVIKPDELMQQLITISKNLDHNNLPLQPSLNNLPGLIDLIVLKAFQTDKRLVFVLQIPLVSNEQFSTYHLYSIPTKNVGQVAYHTIIPESKYIGISKDNRQYLRLNSLNGCQKINDKTSLCKNAVPVSLQMAPCEVNVITKLSTENCRPVMLQFEDYNIIKLKKNKWILILSNRLPFVSTCPQEASRTQMLETNSIITMTPKCTAYIGTTQIYAEEEKSSNHTDSDIIPQIPYDCCEQLPKEKPLELKPIKLQNLNLDELDTAAHKLSEQEEILNRLGQESYIRRHLGTFAIFTISIIAIIVALWCCCKCGLYRKFIGYVKSSDSGNDQPPAPWCAQIFNYCNVSSPATRPQSRQSIHSLDQVSYQADPQTVSFSTSATSRKTSHSSRKF